MYKASSTGSSGGGTGGGVSGGRGPAQSIEINNVPQSDLSADKIENKRICKFEDFGGYEWAKDAIVSLYEKNIIDGVSDKAFMPEKEVKREEFLKMANSLYEEKGRVNPLLSDIDTSSWYFDYICKAFSAGIIKGLGDGTFGVGKGMSREDAAVIIVRMLKPAEIEETAELFADDSDISDYAKASVYYLKKIGVMSGDDTGSFNPKKSLNRAEAAIIINNIINAE